MTTIQLTTYRAALEAIRDGSDAVCTDCGWIGTLLSAMEQATFTAYLPPVDHACPDCSCSTCIKHGANEIAAYVLEQGEKE